MEDMCYSNRKMRKYFHRRGYEINTICWYYTKVFGCEDIILSLNHSCFRPMLLVVFIRSVICLHSDNVGSANAYEWISKTLFFLLNNVFSRSDRVCRYRIHEYPSRLCNWIVVSGGYGTDVGCVCPLHVRNVRDN